MNDINSMKICFKSRPENVAFARVVVGAFACQMNPNLDQIADIKTAVSEAVTNSIVHAYSHQNGDVEMICIIEDDCFKVKIVDYGKGIDDIGKARQPFYTTTNNDERSGMGFTLMEMFSDTLEVVSKKGKGTTVSFNKVIKNDLDE